MSEPLTARRTPFRDDGGYDWIIGIGPSPKSDQRLTLLHGKRSDWPEIVRDFGFTDVNAITFTSFRERAMYALDCDVLDEWVSKAHGEYTPRPGTDPGGLGSCRMTPVPAGRPPSLAGAGHVVPARRGVPPGRRAGTTPPRTGTLCSPWSP